MLKQFPRQIKSTKERIAGYERDMALYQRHSALQPAGGNAEESKFAGMTFPEAVLQIDGQAAIAPPIPSKARLYESRYHHNAVFVGFDQQGIPRYGTLRGTSCSRFMGDANGSDKHFSFSIPARDKSTKLHLFESAIDLLSYCTLELLVNMDWRKDYCLSLAGIYKPKGNIVESTLPAALMQYLKDFPQINEIALHLDNDTAGRLAVETIKTLLPPAYTVSDEPPKRGKNYNDYLKIMLRGRHRPER